MTNSNLVTYKKISPNKTSPRTGKIDTITIHCMVAQWTAKQCCDYFNNTGVATSCNYAVGTDGSIGLCVEEKDRSWCTSSRSNDHRAITIEVASDKKAPYAVNARAYDALIKLVADICKRNNIKKLIWKADKSLIGQPSKQNMTVHRWFSSTACPGEYLYSRMGEIAKKVNAVLDANIQQPTETTTTMYRVRKSWENAASQIGAYRSLGNAKDACIDGYSVYDGDGKSVYSATIEIPATVKQGSSGDAVKQMQTLLNDNGSNLVCDGIFGSKTLKSVKTYQKSAGLTADGICGKLTWTKLLTK